MIHDLQTDVNVDRQKISALKLNNVWIDYEI